MTRDSKILTFIQLAGFCAGLVANTINDPVSYGLTPLVVKWVNLIAIVLTGISGWLRTSPLKGENDHLRVVKTESGESIIVKETGKG